MKKSKTAPVIVETAVGKFLVRDFRRPIPLRTSPRKKKTKLKKEIKRLDEKTKQQQQKRKIHQVKKQINFHDQNNETEENSTLFIISNDEQDYQLNNEELTNSKCK
jgi:hypothetical protein